VLNEKLLGETILRMENPESTSTGWSFSDKLAFALFCLAAIPAIVLYWVDRTPAAAGISVALIAMLVIYPILHLVQKSKLRIIALIFAALLIAGFGWKIWPVKPTVNTGSESAVPPQQSATQQTNTHWLSNGGRHRKHFHSWDPSNTTE
jgi:hypothetical protein